jgi:HAD superfamily hydrolase (TIGR01662 family)
MGRYSTEPNTNQSVLPVNTGNYISSNPFCKNPMSPEGMTGQQINPMSNWPTKFPNPIVGLDLHGTILEKMNDYDDFSINPIVGSLEAIKIMRLKGHKVFILADYPGIIEKKTTIEQTNTIHSNLMRMLGQSGCFSIDGLLYCTSALKQDNYAKPNIGMIDRSKKEMKIDWKNGFFIGDSIEDLKMAEKANLKPILVMTGNGQETLSKLDTFANKELKKKVKIFSDLLSFANSL